MFKRRRYSVFSEDFEADPGETIWLYTNKVSQSTKIGSDTPLFIDGQEVGILRMGERLYITFDDMGFIDSWYTVPT